MKFTRFKFSEDAKRLRALVDSGQAIRTLPGESSAERFWKSYDQWTIAKRPFYRVYPGYIEIVKNLDFTKFLWKAVLPIDPVAIELPETLDYITENLSRTGIEILHVKGAILTVRDETIAAYTYGVTESGKETNSNIQNACLSEDGIHLNLFGAIGVGLQLIQDEPDLITPILLKRDLGKPPTPHLINRAIRNGVYGFDVGEPLPTKEEIEQMKKSGAFHEGEKSPHFRSSYFGLRWTGSGRAIPKVVKIKECFVGLEKMKKVPTGYYEKEDSSGKN